MTAKKKATHLIKRFMPHAHYWVHDLSSKKNEDDEQFNNAKNCALICVETILQEHNTYYDTIGEGLARSKYLFWTDVKTEIESQ